MQWRRLSAVPVILTLALSLFLSACGNSAAQHVTLTFIHWQGGAAAVPYQHLIKAFEAAHPNITVNFELGPTDTNAYMNLLQTRMAGGNSPDIVGISGALPSTKEALVKAGVLLDLSNQPWAARMTPGARTISQVSASDPRVFAEPITAGVGAVYYNKAIFSSLGIAIPTDWASFLQACQKIKAAGIIPLALGAKDGWPLDFMLATMALDSVYRDDPNLAAQIGSGQATYAGSEWKQLLQDFSDLSTKGYLDSNASGTTWPDSANLIGLGKAAMMIQGDFADAPIKQANPNIDLGLFPVPYVPTGVTPVLSTYVDVTLAISAKSKHQAEAEEFLNFLSQPSEDATFLTDAQALPTLTGVTPKLDATILQILPALSHSGDFNAPEDFPAPVTTALVKGGQNILTGTETPAQVLQDMDKAQQQGV